MKKNKKIIIAISITFIFIIGMLGFTIINIREKMDSSAIDLTQNLLDNIAHQIANYNDQDEAFVKNIVQILRI